MSNSGGRITGYLPAGQWCPVLSSMAIYSTVNYSVWTDVTGSKYQCWNALFPFPYASGNLPQNDLTFIVAGWSTMFLHSPSPATYTILPVSG